MQRLVLVLALIFSITFAANSLAASCPKDSVPVARLCVDKYEASVWETTNKNTIRKIRKGRVKDATQLDGVATQRGVGSNDDYPCLDNGNNCADIYAVSIPGVKPSGNLTWFQAAAACANADKRLLTNQEWTVAAAGTPDPGTDDNSTDCNITDNGFPENDPVRTGSRSKCVSRWGTYNMVGNMWEWIADWLQGNTAPYTSSGGTAGPNYGNDFLFGSNPTAAFQGSGQNFPAALCRGGHFGDGEGAGVFTVGIDAAPSFSGHELGLRCARAR